MLFRPGTTRLPLRASERSRKTERRLQRVELDPSTDAHARAAIEAYADSCANDMPWLAELLRASAVPEADALTHCAATTQRVFALAQQWAAQQPDYAHAAWEHVRIHLDAALQVRTPASDVPNSTAASGVSDPDQRLQLERESPATPGPEPERE
ncbi:hypothetical protein [Paraburkholderia megapolitana]|uniref:Uncharacterized protein n=1 Tax=Paraburkholderia megapolitana TaxID=420953 RepID=A0A1I3CZM8_9BURK|nr:hypothetical protein [Paraburkholderia megapolitana]SFH79828.1 hypothetical protein SAMN05192543_10124 [Paraburkholderia megapolitana]